VGNPVCPHEELATIVGKCWVIHAFKPLGARKPPRTPQASYPYLYKKLNFTEHSCMTHTFNAAVETLKNPQIAHSMAIASSRIEGVEPSDQSIFEVAQVVNGHLTGDELRLIWKNRSKVV
jgi:Antitoxin VbhA